MRQNPENSRQPTEQPQGRQPQRQPPRQQPSQQPAQYPQSQPPRQPQQQPPQGQQPYQGNPNPSQGQQPTQPRQPAGRPQHSQPPQGGQRIQSGPGGQPGMAGGQGQKGPQAGVGAQPPRQQGAGHTHLHSVTLQDILQEDVITAEADAPLPAVVSRMKQEDVGAVVVVEDREPLGLVTDRKIALSLDESTDPEEMTAEELMSDEMYAGPDAMSVYDALQQLSDENIRRLPVVDDDGELVGIVTLDDLIVLLGKELQDTAEIIQAQSPRL